MSTPRDTFGVSDPASAFPSPRHRHQPFRPPLPRPRRLTILISVLVVAGAVAGAFVPPVVTVMSPTTMTLRDEAVGSGFVKAKVLVDVSAKVTGVIVATTVDQGDRVTVGQVLARLQDTDIAGQLRQAGNQLEAHTASASTARANVAAARARLRASESTLEKTTAAQRFAQVTLERVRSLVASGILPHDQLDAAETRHVESAREVENAEALRAASAEQVAAAESDAAAAARVTEISLAGVKVQEANLAYTIVRSPVDGYVVTRDLEAGATVVPGLPIVTIADPTMMWVSANIDEREIAGLRVGQTAVISVRSSPDRTLRGTVARIAESADPVTEDVVVDVAFTDGRPAARLNETAEVSITKSHVTTTSIPTMALVDNAHVWVVREGRLERRSVRTGIRDKQGWVQIVSGVTTTDLVVTSPSLQTVLEEGVRVRTRNVGVASGTPIRLLVVGAKLGSFVGPHRIVAGRPITRKHYEVVVDEKSGFGLGERVRLGLEDYAVVGLMTGMVAPSGDPMAFVSLADAQTIQFQLSNEAIRNTRQRVTRTYARLNRLNPLVRMRATSAALQAASDLHLANAIAVTLNDPSDTAAVAAAIRRWNHYEAYTADGEREILLRGFIEKSQRQLWMFRAILVLVSAVIVALIVYTLTMEKLRGIAILKMIGASDRTIVLMVLQQALLLGAAGFGIGYVIISQTYSWFPR